MANADKLKKKRGNADDAGPPLSMQNIMEEMALASSGGDTQRVAELEKQLASLESELDRAIVPVNQKIWKIGRITLQPTSIDFPEDLTEEEISQLGHALSKVDNSYHFWLGDWVNEWIGDETNNNELFKIYEYLATTFGFSRKTLQNVSSVCRNLPSSLRREDLNFTIHRIVAEVKDELKPQQASLLKWASDNNASKRDLLAHIKEISDKPKSQLKGLFAKEEFPKINRVSLFKKWDIATDENNSQTKRSKAKKDLLGEITVLRKWLDDLENSLDE